MASNFTIPKPLGYWEPPEISGAGSTPFGEIVDPGYYEFATPEDVSLAEPQAEAPKSTATKIISGASDHNSQPSGKSMTRDETNNFGYVSKPGIVSAAGMMPGMLGLAGKAVSVGMNANNQAATSQARQTLGLPEQTGWQTAKGIAKDNKGLVSDNVSINNHNYPIGFEAETATGRTTLTPQEARTRANMLGGLTETPAPESANSSALSGIFDEASSVFSSIFGERTRPTEHLDVNQGLSTAERMSKFPDAPSPKGSVASQTDPKKTAGPWGGAGNTTDHTGYGSGGTSGQSVGPSGGGNGGWGGPH